MNQEPEPSHEQLSEEERAAAFASALSSAQRSAALRAGRTPVPPKFILWVMAIFVVLGGGGALLEHYFGNVGQPSATTTTRFTPPSTPTTLAGVPLTSTLASFMGLKEIAHAQAAPFTLTDQHRRSWSLNDQRGHVVVLTFENVNCNDVCPVLSNELRQARDLLGARAHQIEFVIVNADPTHFAFTPNPTALRVAHLGDAASVYFLTGPLLQLNAVWINYGVSVKVGSLATQVAHNDIMYFIDPAGHLRAQAVPFANEDSHGVFTLSASDVHRFAIGVARTASSLVK